jgi:hypothetical protein
MLGSANIWGAISGSDPENLKFKKLKLSRMPRATCSGGDNNLHRALTIILGKQKHE